MIHFAAVSQVPQRLFLESTHIGIVQDGEYSTRIILTRR